MEEFMSIQTEIKWIRYVQEKIQNQNDIKHLNLSCKNHFQF
jgi:hypothetical protein